MKKMASVPQINLANKKMLIVDDNKTDREILRMQIKSWGSEIFEAEDAKSALKFLKHAAKNNEPVDFAIIDLKMPGVDGAELGWIIKNDEDVSSTKLIMLTAVGQRGEAKKMADIGFEGFLTKPLKQSLLYDCLANIDNNAHMDSEEDVPQIVTRHLINEQKKCRILLAEDNLINRKVAIKLLEKIGYETDCAFNGKEAVEAVQQTAYDLILMDMQMPEMDGIEATQTIRGNEPTGERIPIIAMTANAMKGDREKCLEAGMDDYLSKPVNPKKLEEALTRWIKKN